MRLSAALIFLALATTAGADELATEFGGHTKFRAVNQSYPEDSLFRDFVGSDLLDVGADLRLKLKLNSDRWTFDTAYQLVGLQGDGLKLTGPPNDDRRQLDLTHIISEGSDSAILHRLDRLWLGYTSEKAVIRLGRQALSWGNGLAYAPMDLVNPFDPASIDTEYKAGDDMLYVQYLQDSGNDIQEAYVFRRNVVTGESTSDAATAAIKYHGFAGDAEYDLLVARSYGDAVIGVGAGRGIGGAVWSADLVVTDTELDTYVQFVTNAMYSWVWGGKNMSGSLEYYFNGFGQRGGRYDPAGLAGNPDLLVRVSRGELFTLGRHYLSANVMIEMSPLWILTPTVFMNVEDPSALFQLVTTYSLSDNITFLGSVNIPVGPSGSEFGGIESGVPDRYLSTGMGLFAQFAWYF
jgi:hypothetical protein